MPGQPQRALPRPVIASLLPHCHCESPPRPVIASLLPHCHCERLVRSVIASEAWQSRRPQLTAARPRPGGRSPRHGDCRVASAPRNDRWEGSASPLSLRAPCPHCRCGRLAPTVIASALPALSLRAPCPLCHCERSAAISTTATYGRSPPPRRPFAQAWGLPRR